MNYAVFVTAVSQYVVACLATQNPPIVLNGDNAQINFGLDYLAQADVFPRIVGVPSPQLDKYEAAGNLWQDTDNSVDTIWQAPSFVRGGAFDFHIWGKDETQCEMLIAMICEALQQVATGVAWPETGFWPQARGNKTLTDLAGREYVLTVRVKMPVTYATYPMISNISANPTTEMSFPDGTNQKDP